MSLTFVDIYQLSRALIALERNRLTKGRIALQPRSTDICARFQVFGCDNSLSFTISLVRPIFHAQLQLL